MDCATAMTAIGDLVTKVRRTGWTLGSYVSLLPPPDPQGAGPHLPVPAVDTYPVVTYFEGGIGAGVLYENFLNDTLALDWEIQP